MARLAGLLAAAALAISAAHALSSAPAAARHTITSPGQPAANDASPAHRFARWLDAEAARALEAGARARRELSSADQVRGRAEATRRIVLEAMGGLPDTRTPLNARITGGFERDGYRVEHLVFESLPGLYVTANLYVPTGRPGPFPAVLGTAGHSDDGKAAAVYQHAWISFARRGMIVLAYDPPAQGERLEDLDRATGKPGVGSGTQAHSHVGQQCLLTGTSLARYFAWDGIRAFDYLLTRPDVDPARIAVAGNSGGGTQAAWLASVEPRLAGVVSSCYITSWSALWSGPGPQDMEQVLPGFLARGLDFADMILADAPRPYLVSSAIRDFFPIAGARDTVAEARRLYSLLGAGERLHHVETDATHGWSQPLREGAYRWFARWGLADASGDGAEGAVTVEPVELLQVTPSGQVETSFDARTIFDVNLDRARELTRTRPPATRDRMRQFLGIPSTLPVPAAARREPVDGSDGLRTERLELPVEGELTLPALLIHPREERPRGTVVVAEDRAATSIDDRAHVDAGRQWAVRGYLALVLHVRGAGVLAPSKGASGYSSDYQLAARAWLLGTSIVAWQARDLLAGLAFVEHELPGEDIERAVATSGATGPAGLFAAALHPVDRAVVEGAIVSYLDVAGTQRYTLPARIFVPGVLETTDLPEVMALAAPAAVRLVRPVAADGRVLDAPEAASRMPGGMPANVTIDAAGSAAP